MITAPLIDQRSNKKPYALPIEESDLVAACQAREERAFRLLYNHYAPLLMSMAMRYTSRSEEAEDILQESFIKIFKSIEQFKPEGSFEGWIKRILVNTAINHFHKQNRLRERSSSLEEAAIFQNEDADAIDQLSAEELIDQVRQLPEGYRLVFNMYVIEGYDHQEIAKMLNISTGTSRSQLAKAKKKLKETLQAQGRN